MRAVTKDATLADAQKISPKFFGNYPTTRLKPLDALRGFIMIVMALDHANVFIAHGHPRSEMWFGAFPVYDDPLTFFTRAITHLAAPGFFFLMGASMILFTASREKIGWTRGQVIRYFVLRGAILIVLQLVVENAAWIWGEGGPITFLDMPIYLGVLYGLGGAMILGALLVDLDTRLLIAISATLLIGTEIIIRYFAGNILPFQPVTQMVLLPGGTQQFSTLYPVLPWLGVTAFGMAFGRWFGADPEPTYRRALYVGIAFLVVFVPLRALNGFGNIRAQVGTGWIAFLNVVKYPPSITFLLLTLGIDLILLAVFARLWHGKASSRLWSLNPLLVFGKTPLFFYISHLYIYGFIGRTFFPAGIGIPAMYPWWIVGLIILYPLCFIYGRFKDTRPPDSIWRMF